MMSSSTTSLGSRASLPEALRTLGFACPTIASLSRVCLARNSWMMPMPLLAMINSPNMPLIKDPVDSTMRNSTPRMALMRVNTLPRTISETLRAARAGTSLALPSATRWATSASVSPVAVIVVIVAVSLRASGSSEESPRSVFVVVLERQLVTGERRLGNRSRRGVLGDEHEGEDVTVPMLERDPQFRTERQHQLAVDFGDGGRAPVVVAVDAGVDRKRLGGCRIGRRVLTHQVSLGHIHRRERIGVELAPVLTDLAELHQIGELCGQGLRDARRGGVGQRHDGDVRGRDDEEVGGCTEIESPGMAELHAGRRGRVDIESVAVEAGAHRRFGGRGGDGLRRDGRQQRLRVDDLMS